MNRNEMHVSGYDSYALLLLFDSQCIVEYCFVAVCIGDLFVLVYAIDCRESFEEVRRLLEDIYEAKGQYSGSATGAGRAAGGTDPSTAMSDPPVGLIRRRRGKNCPPVVVVGNKCDRELHRMVTPGDLQDLVDSMPQCVGLEASAKKNHNVHTCIHRCSVVSVNDNYNCY